MNRFRTKKVKKEVVDDGMSEISTVPSMRVFKRKKTVVEQPKPELDLANALPDTNDFRTSLLMPNLSARFSMLREQDDPTSKIGKANDDSVLFPKRQSRLNLFAHNPLTEVPEVLSISGVIRPPFAYPSRTGSFASEGGYDSEDGVMSPTGSWRSRPGEGNNMFGGRQKIYQIPIGASSSVRNFSALEAGNRDSGRALGGRARYEDDVTLTAFKDDREARRAREDADGQDWPDYSQDKGASSPVSNVTGVNRGTSSSTASHKRDSTAATSVESQNATPDRVQNPATSTTSSRDAATTNVADLERTATINKRLYGHSFEQQGFQSSRKLSNADQRQASSASQKSLSQSRSAHNLNEKFIRGGPVYASSSFRTASPPPSATPPGFSPLDSAVRDGKPNPDASFGYVPPLSPPISDAEDVTTFNNAVQPEDRGKATALGLFNKPQQYDESQFSERQRQLYQDQGRESPVPLDEGPPAMARSQTPVQPKIRPRADSAAQKAAAFNQQRLGSQKDEFLPLKKATPPRLNTGEGTFLENFSSDDDTSPITRRTPPLRLRKPSNAPHPFRSTPTPEPEERSSSRQAYSRAEDRPSSRQTTSRAEESRPSSRQAISRAEDRPSSRQAISRAEDRPSSRQANSRPLEDRISEEHLDRAGLEPVTEQNESDPIDEDLVILPSPVTPSSHQIDDSDSPTLGPGAGLGLSGLIRSHLRQDSDQSSIHPLPSPGHGPRPSYGSDRFGPNGLVPRSLNQPASSHSNPWEFDDYFSKNEDDTVTDSPETPSAPAPPPISMKSRARQILEQAQALRDQEMSKSQRVLGMNAPRLSQDSGVERSWQNSSKAQRILGDDAPRARQAPPIEARIPRPNVDAPPPIENHPMNRNLQDGPTVKHTRGASTETQRERDDFAKELEERRRKVQEVLKEHAEGASRSASPVAGLFESPMKAGNAFSMLKPKSSRGSLREPTQPPQSKAMKMLGIGSVTMSSTVTSTSPKPPQDNMWKDEEEEMLRNFGKAKKAPSPTLEKHVQHPVMNPPSLKLRESSDEPRESPRRPLSPPSPKSSHRDRSSSDISSGRSKSRNGRYRDDLDKAMFEGTSSTASAYISNEDFRPPKLSMETMQESPAERSESAMSGRFRSSSRTGYFDTKPLLPIQTNAPPKFQGLGLPPRPSPRTPYSANSTPPLFETSPAVTPTSAIAPPTPHSIQNGFPVTHSSKALAGRKRSVNKSLISEPTFLSSTSSVNTVGLPPGASLQNGIEPSPSRSQFSPTIPPMNPRRRRGTTTQTILGAFGRSDKHDYQPPTPGYRDDHSTFSDEGENRRHKSQGKERQRLRKSSSEGGSLNARARQQAYAAPSPAVPNFPRGVKPDGGMF